MNRVHLEGSKVAGWRVTKVEGEVHVKVGDKLTEAQKMELLTHYGYTLSMFSPDGS